MSDAPLMLGVSGLRGIVGKSLTPEVAARFAGAFGAWVREKAAKQQSNKATSELRTTIVIGRDGRAGGEKIQDGAVRGLLGAGCEVIDLGVAMTPTVAVMTDQLAGGGMVVTASHNPQEWNGLKCLVKESQAEISACAPDAATAQEIIARFRAEPVTGGRGTVEKEDRSDEHHVTAVWNPLASLLGMSAAMGNASIAVDSVNGAGRTGAAEMLRRLGCTRVVHIGNGTTGLFPHPPEPQRENLGELCSIVRERGAIVGFAQDPDADRLAIVDERGEYIGEEYTLVLAAEALLSETAKQRDSETGKKQARVLVTNLSTSRMIDDVAARHGARVIRTAVGEANVVEAMKREAAAGREVVVGGEGNGGVIWPRVTYVRDSLSAMGLVLSLMARRQQKLSEIVAGMPSYAIEKRKVELAKREDAKPAVEKIAGAYSRERIDRQDGVRVDFESGPLAGRAWLHVRASNTEPIMRLIAEAPTAAEARRVLEEAARVIAK